MVSAATVKRLVSATLLAALFYGGQVATAGANDGVAAQQEQITERQTKLAAALYNAVVRNWLVLDVPASQPVVTVRFNLKRDGSLIGEPVVETQSDDPLFPQFAETAVRAVKKAAPFDLAAYDDLYKDWETVIINFDGRSLLDEVTQEEEQPLPTLEELAGFMTEKGPATGKETETVIQVREKVERRNRESHVLALEKYMADGTPVTFLAYCSVDPAEGEFVYGVDFGLNVTWTGQQPVNVEIDGNPQSYRMHAMWRSLFIEGDTAKAALSKLLAASSTLKFSGPKGASASFDLADAGDNFARFKTLCAL